MRGTLTIVVLCVAAFGCADDGHAPMPEAVGLRCSPDPLVGPEVIATGAINLRDVGPCGDIVFQSFTAGVAAQTLLTPGQDPVVVVGQPRGFSPAGDRLAINGATGQVYDTGSGDTFDLFEGFGSVFFLRDQQSPPNVYTVGCGEEEVRVLDPDGSVRTLATDVVSCPASAPHAPILLFQDDEGRLHRLDVSSGHIVSLEEILYSDGTTTFPGSGRSDLLHLSSDGEVVVHHQRSWGGGREWATLTRTSDGEVLGALPDANVFLDVRHIPGGHVMAISTGRHLWVLDRDYQFRAYEDLKVDVQLADRQLLVWSEQTRELFLFEPGTGFRSEPLYLDESEDAAMVQRPRVTASEDGLFIVIDTRRRCGTAQCQRIELHDVRAETATLLFEGEGDVNTRVVTNDGHAVMDGVFRRVGATVYERDIRVYGPAGQLIATFDDRNFGRASVDGDVLYLQSFDVMFGSAQLDRIDGTRGSVDRIADGLSDYRLAGQRLYYLTLQDVMGSSELIAVPSGS